ncbi:MAG: GDSL family lipase [Actinobacteria bacterium 13_2_20CM_2_71_6]|nr:MAG: GDSL family lipase [Actinobacteria bacterium 13_2_20CM_2_71_6]
MAHDYSTTLEAADPYCLRGGEAATLLAGHPWKRFVVLGDSVAEGIGDRVEGYDALPFPDRLAAELTRRQPELAYLNLGRRNLRTAQVRAQQLGPALAFGPDLALVVCGANDALRPGYEARAEAVDRELAAMVRALLDHGAHVLTVSLFVLSSYPGVPAWLRAAFRQRMRLLARRTTAVAATLGTIHVDLAAHPAGADPDMQSGDGLHGNGRSQAIAAAQAVRRLGAHLGNTFPTEPRA